MVVAYGARKFTIGTVRNQWLGCEVKIITFFFVVLSKKFAEYDFCLNITKRLSNFLG